jgi:hypothetical protein
MSAPLEREVYILTGVAKTAADSESMSRGAGNGIDRGRRAHFRLVSGVKVAKIAKIANFFALGDV